MLSAFSCAFSDCVRLVALLICFMCYSEFPVKAINKRWICRRVISHRNHSTLLFYYANQSIAQNANINNPGADYKILQHVICITCHQHKNNGKSFPSRSRRRGIPNCSNFNGVRGGKFSILYFNISQLSIFRRNNGFLVYERKQIGFPR